MRKPMPLCAAALAAILLGGCTQLAATGDKALEKVNSSLDRIDSSVQQGEQTMMLYQLTAANAARDLDKAQDDEAIALIEKRAVAQLRILDNAYGYRTTRPVGLLLEQIAGSLQRIVQRIKDPESMPPVPPLAPVPPLPLPKVDTPPPGVGIEVK